MARILIADDDAHIVRVLTIWLNQNGHQIVCARNGEEALQVIDCQPVDLIISDMNMPRLDGLGLVKTVRAKLGPELPIMLFSARCDHAKLNEQLLAYGVTVYPKPFLPSQLVVEINRRLGVPAA